MAGLVGEVREGVVLPTDGSDVPELLPDGGIAVPETSDPSGEPAIEHVFVEDLTVDASVNGGAVDSYRISTNPGDAVVLHIESPGGSHDFVNIPLFFGQLIPTGSEPGSFPGLPEIRIAPVPQLPVLLIYDGSTAGPFAPAALPPGGLTFAFNTPVGLSGSSLACQPLVTGAATTNNIFAAGNVVVVDL